MKKLSIVAMLVLLGVMEGLAAESATRGLYFVGFHDPIDTPHARSLGVQGPYLNGWLGREDALRQKGYFAWLAVRDAEALKTNERVACVHSVRPENKLVRGEPDRDAALLHVTLAPNGWKDLKEQDQGTYLSVDDLLRAWTPKLDAFNATPLRDPGDASSLRFSARGESAKRLVEFLRKEPQVVHLEWTPTVMRTFDGH